jgi:hypothetical protein
MTRPSILHADADEVAQCESSWRMTGHSGPSDGGRLILSLRSSITTVDNGSA